MPEGVLPGKIQILPTNSEIKVASASAAKNLGTQMLTK